MEGAASWPTAVLKSDNQMMPFFLNKLVKSDHAAQIKTA